MSPRLTALIVMSLWAACYPLIALGLAEAPHLTFAALRAGIAGAALLAIAVLTRAPWPRAPAQWGWLALAGSGMTGIGYFGMFHGAAFVSPGLATVLENLQPLIAGLLAALVLGERPGPAGWGGLLLGFAGIALIALPGLDAGDGSSLVGFGYILAATTGVALGNLAIKHLTDSLDAAMAMGLQLLIGALPLSALALAFEDPAAVRWSPVFLVSLIGLALPGTALAFWLWHQTLARLDISKAVAFSFVVPVIGLTAGWLFYGERLSPLALGGAGLSVLGVYLASRAPGQAASATRSRNSLRAR